MSIPAASHLRCISMKEQPNTPFLLPTVSWEARSDAGTQVQLVSVCKPPSQTRWKQKEC